MTIHYGGASRAFYAVSGNATNINGTVTGVNEGHGIGVWGEQRNDTVGGTGVVGVAGHLGRGGSFQGGAASLRLVPATAGSHPTTGKVGDVFVDSSAPDLVLHTRFHGSLRPRPGASWPSSEGLLGAGCHVLA